MTDSRHYPVDTIVAAARRCYIARGISATGMQEVADCAGMARSTVYRYFPGRDDLLVATIKGEMEQLNKRLRHAIWSSDVIVRFGEEVMDHVISPARDAGLLQDAVRPEILVEWVYRLLLSFLTLPSNWVRSDAQLRATLHALLVPVLLK